jgi:hypothetical protein
MNWLGDPVVHAKFICSYLAKVGSFGDSKFLAMNNFIVVLSNFLEDLGD